MPRPRVANTAIACTVGRPMARPSDAPMNGAVQGEAMAVASTPVSRASATGCRACSVATALGST